MFAARSSKDTTESERESMTPLRSGSWLPAVLVAVALLGSTQTFAQTCDEPGRLGSTTLLSDVDAGTSAVAWTGSEFAVVWSDGRDGSPELYFARFDTSGNKIGADVQLTSGSIARAPSLVWNGSEFGLAYQIDAASVEIWFVRLDTAGAAIGSATQISDSPDNSFVPSLVWNGSEYAVAWEDYRHGDSEIYFARIDSTGAQIGSDVRITNATDDSWEPVLVWNGTEYAIAWYDFRTSSQIFFTRVDSLGAEIGDDIAVTSDTGWAQTPSMVWNGTRYGLSWEDYRNGNPEIYFARLNSSGNQTGPDVRVTDDPNFSWISRLVWTGGEFGLVWQDDRSGIFEVYFTRLDGNGNEQGDDLRLSFSAIDSNTAALAWGEDRYAMAWLEYEFPSTEEAYFTVIGCNCIDADGDGGSGICNSDCDDANPNCTFDCTDGDGDGFCFDYDCDDTVAACTNDCDDLDGDGFAVCGGDCDDADGQVNPGAAERSCDGIDNDCDPVTVDVFDSDGDGFICDTDCNDGDPGVYPGAFDVCDGIDNDCDMVVDEDEACPTSCPLPGAAGPVVRVTSSNSAYLSAVAQGGGFPIVWQQGSLYFGKLDGFGNLIQGPIQVTQFNVSGSNPQLVWNGSGFGVFWLKWNNVDYEIWFRNLDASGNPTSPETQVTVAAADPLDMSIAWSGSVYGLTWTDERNTFGDDIYLAIVDTSGSIVGGEIQHTSSTEEERRPLIAWNGSEFGVVWLLADSGGGAMLSRFDTTGAQIGSDVQVVDNRIDSQLRASLIWNGSEYGYAWRRVGTVIWFTRFDATGSVLSDASAGFASGTGGPSTVWNGSEYVVAWDNYKSISAARVDASGTSLDLINVVQNEPASLLRNVGLLWNFGTLGVVWIEVSGRRVSFRRIECNCTDADGDLITTCWPDCDDSDPSIKPGGPELCDGKNNTCEDPNWPTVPPDEADADGDTVRICAGDCDDSAAAVYPGASQICDGVNNDCNDMMWPMVPTDDVDGDNDGFAPCAGDCDDILSSINPNGYEICNARDDDCDGLTDEDANGEDADADGAAGLCDNCPTDPNADQTDVDSDGFGDICDNCDTDPNPSQSDTDSDFVGDRCDNDDGVIYMWFDTKAQLDWQTEGYATWNSYRGDLVELRNTTTYTQFPLSNPLAAQVCGLSSPQWADGDPIAPGSVGFYLSTADPGVETSLGQDSDSNDRLNTNPCP